VPIATIPRILALVSADSTPDSAAAAPSLVRDLRAAIAVAAAIAALLLPLPGSIPALIPLVAIASLSLWLEGTAWSAVGLRAAISFRLEAAVGSACGLAALAAGVWLFAPGLGITGFNAAPEVRGNGAFLVSALTIAWATAFAAEMLFRGWLFRLVEEAALRHRLPPAAAIAWGVLASAAFQVAVLDPGGPVAAFGAFLAAIGYAALYLGSGRSLVAPIACRGAFDSANLFLIYFKLI
jgi:membrane protease YdiL (CAAX protease family)